MRAKLAKYDLIDIDRFRYDSIGSNTWSSIKALNPNTQIYLYEMGPESPSYLDSSQPQYVNGLARHNVSRGHPMGSLNGNQPACSRKMPPAIASTARDIRTHRPTNTGI
jgi:hypothetical protein